MGKAERASAKSFRETTGVKNSKELPIGEEAVAFAITLANDALLETFPALNTPHFRRKFLKRNQITFTDPHDFPQGQRQTKKANDIHAFSVVLEAGVPCETLEDLVYIHYNPDMEFFPDCDGDEPALYLDQKLYTLALSTNNNERAGGIDGICTALIHSNIVSLPDERQLPKDPWVDIIRRKVETGLLPLIHGMMLESGISDLHVLTETSRRILEILDYRGASDYDERDKKTRGIINTMMNNYFQDTQEANDVEWEADKNSQIVAKGTRVFYLLPWQKLPTFEFQAGNLLDIYTAKAFANSAKSNYYVRVIQQFGPDLFLSRVKKYANNLSLLPPLYAAMGMNTDQAFASYINSSIPGIYLSMKDKLFGDNEEIFFE